ncbi:PHP domain-containing protein [Alicyclobacillus kakegawensis]|uniref:PHP domain-containing protein n=1 Tax=Alicyclobacillus kakegawensis TaxID=392012 RepID=UPI0008330B1A|nr:PHP domain-containing protein [Alicyclobacillus kakegawensis]
MNKREIVRCLRLANDLWAIEGANPFRVRAHERAAEAILESPLAIEEILALPPGSIRGVGRETLAMIRELQEHGMSGLLGRMRITTPVDAAELLRLPGIGPKTARRLVHDMGICSPMELKQALASGALREVPGLGVSRLARLRRELDVLLERKLSTPIAAAWPLACQLVQQLEACPCVQRAAVTGAARRLASMMPTVDLVVACTDTRWLTQWAQSMGELVSRSDGGGPVRQGPADDGPDRNQDTPSVTVASQDHLHRLEVALPWAGESARVRLYAADATRFPQVWMRTTGDSTHQQVVAALLAENGVEWTADDRLVRGGKVLTVRDEADLYRLAGLPFYPPEVREGRGVLCDVGRLIQQTDIRGDLHVHTNWSDGLLSISQVVEAAEARGYEYVAITDHSRSLTIAGGLTPERVRQQAREIAQVRARSRIKILHGIEVDILPDGRLDLPDGVLMELDLVIASVHSALHQPRAQLTERVLAAIEHPAVHVIGHLTGRLLGRRSACDLDTGRLLQRAVELGVMFELNANPNRLDIAEDLLREAKSQGMKVPINTDAHHEPEFNHMEYGVRMARRGWLYREDVLNTLPYEELMERLRTKRHL